MDYVAVKPLLYARLIWHPGDCADLEYFGALLDSGATSSFISLAAARFLRLEIWSGGGEVQLGQGTTHIVGYVMLQLGVVMMRGLPHQCAPFRLNVVDGLSLPCVLGRDWLAAQRIIWDFATDTLLVDGINSLAPAASLHEALEAPVSSPDLAVDQVPEPFPATDVHPVLFHMWLMQVEAHMETLPELLARGEPWLAEEPLLPHMRPDSPGSSVTDDVRMSSIVGRYHRVFQPLTELPPRRGEWDLRIDLAPDAKPKKRAAYRLSQREREAARAVTDKKQGLGWMRPSRSPWGAPLIFAEEPRKDGSPREVFDYRDVNFPCERNAYPLPRIPDMIQWFQGKRYYTFLDLRKAFNQLRIAEGHEYKTAILTPHGLFESLVVELGLRNSGPQCQAVVDCVLRGDPTALPRYPVEHHRHDEAEARRARIISGEEKLEDLSSVARAYVDDIGIATVTEEDHYIAVEKVLARLDLFDLRINEFHEFGMDSITLLGYRVTPAGVELTDDRVKAFRDWVQPTNAATLWKFLGLANFYREFVPRFSTYSRHLTPLVQKGAEWEWTDEAQRAFVYIKDAICDRIRLLQPDESLPFEIVTDSSIYGIGGVLLQAEGGTRRTVAFYSRQTSSGERKLGQYELEFAGVVACCKHWRHFIEGSDVTVWTDHEPLVTGRVFEQSNPHRNNRRIHRWISELQQYAIRLRHHRATTPIAEVADAFSRRPDYEEAGLKDLNAYIKSLPQPEIPTVDAGIQVTLATMMTIDDRLVAGWMDADADQMYALGYEYVNNKWYRHGRRVVPLDDDLRTELIRDHHEPGHRGAAATLRALQRRFFWPLMRDDVRRYVRRCAVCGRMKSRNWRRMGPPLPLPVASAAWRELQIDFVTSLPPSRVGKGRTPYNRIAVVIDRFSKMVVLIPCQDTITATDFATLFIDYVWRRFGLPDSIHSDSDTLFVAEAWTETLRILEIAKHLAAPYRKSAGQAERANQSVESVLRCICEKEEDWAAHLGVVEFVLNETPHDALGLCPFEMGMGWIPRFGRRSEMEVEGAHSGEAAEKARQAIRDHVRERLLREQARMATVQPERTNELDIGQWAYLATDNLRLAWLPKDARLRPRWIGPFVILEKYGSRTYGLDIPTHWRIKNRIDADRLKPCMDDTKPVMKVRIAEDGTRHVEHEIEKITGHTARGRGRKRCVDELNVRWVGYAAEYDERWKAAKAIREIPSMVRDYVTENDVKLTEADAVLLETELAKSVEE